MAGKYGKGCGQETSAMETAVQQYHRWDDIVFKKKDGIPPLVNVELTAFTMDFFMREKKLLRLLFAKDPEYPRITNTNMATMLYERGNLLGIAIEYGDSKSAYIEMKKLEPGLFRDLPYWRFFPKEHESAVKDRIRELTGKEIGLVKCADLEGFFGGLGKVVNNENLLEMLLEGVKFAAESVAFGNLNIQPEPWFFSYLRVLNRFAGKMDAKAVAEGIQDYLPNFSMGLVLKGEEEFACVSLGAESGNLYFEDFGDVDFSVQDLADEKLTFMKLVLNYKNAGTFNFAVGVSTDFLYNAMHAAMTASPYKLGKAVFNAVRKGELVVC